MKYTKTSPVGIDKVIKVVQDSLYNKIQTNWELIESQILSFGRVDRITDNKTNKQLLRYYNSDNYLDFDMLYNDKYACQFFFTVNEDIQFSTHFEADVQLYMFIDLSVVKSSITYRADEEVKQDVWTWFKPTDWFVGFGSANDLPGFESKMNMNKNCAFKVNLKLKYR